MSRYARGINSKIMSEFYDRDGNIVQAGDFVRRNDTDESEVCVIWRYDSTTIGVIVKQQHGYTSFCSDDCEERRAGICKGSYATGIAGYTFSRSGGCDECRKCVNLCKMEKPCMFLEEGGK